MRHATDAARRLRDSNPVAGDAFAGAAGDSLGRATFECITDSSAEQAQTAGRAPYWRRPFWLATAAAGVAVIAMAAVVVPGALLNGAGGPVAYAASVVKRVSSALTAADPGTFAQMKVSTTVAPVSGGKTTTSTAEEWSYGDRWRSVTYSPSGRPVYDEGSTASSVYTLVSYPKRTWARQPGLGPAGLSSGPGDCRQLSTAGPLLFQPSLPGTGPAASTVSATSPLTVARVLRAAVSCGTLDVAARQRIGGIEAIKLTRGQQSPISETIWVNPGTYLPVRVVIRSFPHHSLVLNNKVVLQQTADFSWLPPTPQNLARLGVPIPGGFRHVTFGQAAWPIMQQMHGLLPIGAPGPALGYLRRPGRLHGHWLGPGPR